MVESNLFEEKRRGMFVWSLYNYAIFQLESGLALAKRISGQEGSDFNQMDELWNQDPQ